MGNLWLTALPALPGIFFQKQLVNLEIYIECTGQESYLHALVFIFVRCFDEKKGEREVRKRENLIFLEFWTFLDLFYLWRDGWRGKCLLGNSEWLEFLLILFFSRLSNFQRIFKKLCIHFFCGKIELFYFALSEKCLFKILTIQILSLSPYAFTILKKKKNCICHSFHVVVSHKFCSK